MSMEVAPVIAFFCGMAVGWMLMFALAFAAYAWMVSDMKHWQGFE